MLIGPVASRLRRGQRRRDHVAHIYVVAGLGAVAEDGRPPAVAQQAAEDRDHAGLAERVLARAVDVAEPQGDAGEAVEALVQRQVALGRVLALAVGGAAARSARPRRAAAAGPRPRRRSRRRWRRRRRGRAPAARAASSTLAVPPTLIAASKAGSASDLRTSIWAARWKTPRAAARRPARSARRRRGCRARPARRPPASAPSRFSRRPVERSSTTVTSSPRASSASTRFEPMKPAPPVTRALHRGRRSYGDRRAARHDGASPSAPATLAARCD